LSKVNYSEKRQKNRKNKQLENFSTVESMNYTNKWLKTRIHKHNKQLTQHSETIYAHHTTKLTSSFLQSL